ncbi:MAG: prolyl oligopeptidase family serine peptidase [Planctomycetes bacterium]|nr:prolyl oligopeptidase family serine peptidase [Planctomycetota bacterium]
MPSKWIRIGLLTVVGAYVAAFTPAQAEPPTWSVAFDTNEKLPKEFKQFTIKRADGSDMTAFLGHWSEDHNAKKPLIIFCEGSGAGSLFMKVGDKIGSSLFGILAKAACKDYHVVSIEKRGVKFLDRGPAPGSGEGASDEYNEHATLEDRTDDVCLLIAELLKQPTVDASRVLVVGSSEGADVAAAAAAKEPRITHCACISGGGVCQFFDFAVLRRKQMQKEGASAEEIEKSVEELESQYQAILRQPRSIKKFFMGHAYRRWSSFTLTCPADSLRKSSCKLFLAHGSADESVPVESFDACVFDLIRSGREEMTIRRYPGRGHGLMTPGLNGADAFKELFDDLLKWAAKG